MCSHFADTCTCMNECENVHVMDVVLTTVHVRSPGCEYAHAVADRVFDRTATAKHRICECVTCA